MNRSFERCVSQCQQIFPRSFPWLAAATSSCPLLSATLQVSLRHHLMKCETRIIRQADRCYSTHPAGGDMRVSPIRDLSQGGCRPDQRASCPCPSSRMVASVMPGLGRWVGTGWQRPDAGVWCSTAPRR
ncbi:hypothetical protein PAPYR_7055 [Paratrimastix pyriformis]|uniref:Uncharacterized protein n=1 Tax=Paratrimastix pyriformis TaxID=342808 RepID=A0ABQ8UDZ2_9EUKA|nr:hypothetical protein PAPYR_7055 [Paratrimastix pyriformis]